MMTDDEVAAQVPSSFDGDVDDWYRTPITVKRWYWDQVGATVNGKKMPPMPPLKMDEPSGPAFLIQERRKQHGSWTDQSRLAHQLKEIMRRGKNWSMLEHHQSEALDMIATKVSRILTGDAAHADHWDDIGGYALLGKGGHDEA